MLSELYLDREAIGDSEHDFINTFIRQLTHRGPVQFIIKKDTDDEVVYFGIRKLAKDGNGCTDKSRLTP